MITKPPFKYIKDPIFISFTSLSDFLKCPRSYYLKNIYRDPKTHFRLQVASPYLSLGSTVHDSVKWFLDMKGQVVKKQLEEKFRNYWLKFSGKRGGFSSKEEEASFGQRGLKMLNNFFRNWRVLEKSAPAITFPKLSLVENLVLMGNFDFVGVREDGALHIVDFKTGANDEKDPTQLYIYAILAEANLERPVTKISFWYLDREDEPREVVLDPLGPKLDWLKEKGKELKKVIEKGDWRCIKENARADLSSSGLCGECRIYTDLIEGRGEFQFSDYRYKKDVYYLGK
jgi:hypothetical protein